MKSTWTKILFSALVLTLAACSGGGGGGGGGGSANGDTANNTPTITNPPTVAKGTSEEMTTLVTAAGTSVDGVVTRMLSSLGGTLSVFGGGESCTTEDGTMDAVTGDKDSDGYFAFYKRTATNCQYPGEEPYVGLTENYNDELVYRDENDNDPYSSASFTYKESSSYKNSSGSEMAAEYSAFSSVLIGSSGILNLRLKAGEYDNHSSTKVSPRYVALWLSLQFSEGQSPLLALNATVSGFLQFYVQGAGLVTVGVTSIGVYTLQGSCLTGGQLSIKYADGNDVVPARSQMICLDSFGATKAGLK
ncbi:hypothetical protein [Bdellovibrio sp.]|uniref:hypothetical protein n=1 Tax=Bdellovibrio sp. TaxID=28201 RepID=UPI003221F50D